MKNLAAKAAILFLVALAMTVLYFVGLKIFVSRGDGHSQMPQTAPLAEAQKIPGKVSDKVICLGRRVVDDKLDDQNGGNELGLMLGTAKPDILPAVQSYYSAPAVIEYRGNRLFYYRETVFVDWGQSDKHSESDVIVAGFKASEAYATPCGQAVRVEIVSRSETDGIKEALVRELGESAASHIEFWGLNGGW